MMLDFIPHMLQGSHNDKTPLESRVKSESVDDLAVTESGVKRIIPPSLPFSQVPTVSQAHYEWFGAEFPCLSPKNSPKIVGSAAHLHPTPMKPCVSRGRQSKDRLVRGDSEYPQPARCCGLSLGHGGKVGLVTVKCMNMEAK